MTENVKDGNEMCIFVCIRKERKTSLFYYYSFAFILLFSNSVCKGRIIIQNRQQFVKNFHPLFSLF